MKVSQLVSAVGALTSVLGSVGAASADVQWETRVRYVVNGNPATSLIVGDGPVEVTVQAGIFNLTGLGANQANHGLNMWGGNLTSTAGGLSLSASDGRIAPYNYGPATSFGGQVQPGGGAIDGGPTPGSLIYSARAIAPSEPVAWTLGQPQPLGPTDYGVESFVNVFRFVFTMTPSISSTTITATGVGGPILRWSPLTVQAPEESQPNGFVSFIGLSPTPVNQAYSPQTLVFTRVPSPGAAAVLLLAPALRRRRKEAAIG